MNYRNNDCPCREEMRHPCFNNYPRDMFWGDRQESNFDYDERQYYDWEENYQSFQGHNSRRGCGCNQNNRRKRCCFCFFRCC